MVLNEEPSFFFGGGLGEWVRSDCKILRVGCVLLIDYILVECEDIGVYYKNR